MNWKMLVLALAVFAVAVQCTTAKVTTAGTEDRVRQLQPSDVSSYHDPVKLEVAWVPYTEHKLEWTKGNEWKVVRSDADTSAAMPMMLITYPYTFDTLWLDMNLDNETLGRLMKHTLMTQQPITRPFTEYVEAASCTKCHPEHIDRGFK